MKDINLKREGKLYGNDYLRIGDEEQSINDWIRNNPQHLSEGLKSKKLFLDYKCYKKLQEKL